MQKYLISSICVIAAQSVVCGKSLFDYNVNPEHDLVAAEARSYSNFWSYGDYDSQQPHRRHKNHGHGYGRGHGHGPDYYDDNKFGSSTHYGGPHSFEYDNHEYGNPDYHDFHRPGHGGPPFKPGHGGPPFKPGHGGSPFKPGHGRPNHPHQPPRFPPPPVYENDFINPWGGVTVQMPPQPMVPAVTTTSTAIPVTRATTTTTTTTRTPPISTTTADGLIYDIDVRFGQ